MIFRSLTSKIFTAILLEVVTFILTISWLGFLSAFGLLFLQIIAGIIITRIYLYKALRRVSAQRLVFNAREEYAQDILFALAALLLVKPGFLGFIIGLLLLISSQFRNFLWSYLKKKLFMVNPTATNTNNFKNKTPQILDLDEKDYTHLNK